MKQIGGIRGTALRFLLVGIWLSTLLGMAMGAQAATYYVDGACPRNGNGQSDTCATVAGGLGAASNLRSGFDLIRRDPIGGRMQGVARCINNVCTMTACDPATDPLCRTSCIGSPCPQLFIRGAHAHPASGDDPGHVSFDGVYRDPVDRAWWLDLHFRGACDATCQQDIFTKWTPKNTGQIVISGDPRDPRPSLRLTRPATWTLAMDKPGTQDDVFCTSFPPAPNAFGKDVVQQDFADVTRLPVAIYYRVPKDFCVVDSSCAVDSPSSPCRCAYSGEVCQTDDHCGFRAMVAWYGTEAQHDTKCDPSNAATLTEDNTWCDRPDPAIQGNWQICTNPPSGRNPIAGEIEFEIPRGVSFVNIYGSGFTDITNGPNPGVLPSFITWKHLELLGGRHWLFRLSKGANADNGAPACPRCTVGWVFRDIRGIAGWAHALYTDAAHIDIGSSSLFGFGNNYGTYPTQYGRLIERSSRERNRQWSCGGVYGNDNACDEDADCGGERCLLAPGFAGWLMGGWTGRGWSYGIRISNSSLLDYIDIFGPRLGSGLNPNDLPGCEHGQNPKTVPPCMLRNSLERVWVTTGFNSSFRVTSGTHWRQVDWIEGSDGSTFKLGAGSPHSTPRGEIELDGVVIDATPGATSGGPAFKLAGTCATNFAGRWTCAADYGCPYLGLNQPNSERAMACGTDANCGSGQICVRGFCTCSCTKTADCAGITGVSCARVSGYDGVSRNACVRTCTADADCTDSSEGLRDSIYRVCVDNICRAHCKGWARDAAYHFRLRNNIWLPDVAHSSNFLLGTVPDSSLPDSAPFRPEIEFNTFAGLGRRSSPGITIALPRDGVVLGNIIRRQDAQAAFRIYSRVCSGVSDIYGSGATFCATDADCANVRGRDIRPCVGTAGDFGTFKMGPNLWIGYGTTDTLFQVDNTTVTRQNIAAECTARGWPCANDLFVDTDAEIFADPTATVRTKRSFFLKAPPNPAIDAFPTALTPTSFAWDVDGNARPQGPAWDIGADEYVPSAGCSPGDVNCDGAAGDSSDIQLVVDVRLGLVTDQAIIQRADLNSDTKVDAADIQAIVNMSLGV